MRARDTASSRVEESSLVSTAETWFSAVRGDKKSRSAIRCWRDPRLGVGGLRLVERLDRRRGVWCVDSFLGARQHPHPAGIF